MKTARFSDVVKRCGQPEAHLVLIEPAKDKALQSAIKHQRVLTVMQPTVGTKADYGTVGFEGGGSRQYLVFPKSLRAFVGKRIVGIKYDLLSAKELPASRRAAPPKPPRPKRSPKKAKSKQRETVADEKVIHFRPTKEKDSDEERSITQIKQLARRAMSALEEGKQVVAFNLLKRIIAE